MAGSTRDRVTVDLRGIGEAVRGAARARGTTVAALARQALLGALDASPAAVIDANASADPRSTVKLTLRLSSGDAEPLVLSARSLGLSYGAYVAGLVRGAPLPKPAADRTADRAALLTSSDQLAALSTDLNAFMRLLRQVKSAEIEAYRHRIASVDTDIRRHLGLASSFMSKL